MNAVPPLAAPPTAIPPCIAGRSPAVDAWGLDTFDSDGSTSTAPPIPAKPDTARHPRRRPRIAVVASLASSLVNFRLELLRAMAQRADVLAIAPEPHEPTERALREIGVRFAVAPMARTGVDPRRDVVTLLALYRLFRTFKPDVVLPYTMKPIIYGCLAARLARVPRSYALCTGAGYAFTAASPGSSEGVRLADRRKALVRALSVPLYRLALRRANGVFAFNDADAAMFRERRLAPPSAWIRTIAGSGVDLARFSASPPPTGPPVFLMIARLLRDKGVREFVGAARRLKATHPGARCRLIGPFDSNPTAISRREVEEWVAEGAVEYGGAVDDVRPHLASCSVFVLPSYREGLSRTVLEAMASGRAVITTNGPGCAEPVRCGRTGLVVDVDRGRHGDHERARVREVHRIARVAQVGGGGEFGVRHLARRVASAA